MTNSLEESPLIGAGDVPAGHRSGFVSVVGRPNVGKSTLMNALLGEKLAIVSSKPQTTRDRQSGILTLPDAQIIFIDTPGIHEARTPLGKYMVEVAAGAIPDADIILFLVDLSQPPTAEDERIAGLVRKAGAGQVLLVLNKADLIAPEIIESQSELFQVLVPNAQRRVISALQGDQVPALLQALIQGLPAGPRYYPEDQLTDMYVRDNAAEIIREHVLQLYQEEIPHSVAVQVEEFKERSAEMTYISATIYVERDSQKGIIIGEKGQALKKLGKIARPALEELVGTSIYLDLWVKVLKNWRRDERALRRLGYYHKE